MRWQRHVPSERAALLLFMIATFATRAYVANRGELWGYGDAQLNGPPAPSATTTTTRAAPYLVSRPPPPPHRTVVTLRRLKPPPPPPPYAAPPPRALPEGVRGLGDGWLDLPPELLAAPPPPPPPNDDMFQALLHGASAASDTASASEAMHHAGAVALTRAAAEEAGALHIPKIDNSHERVFPDPSLRLYGKPYATNREIRRKWDLARRNTGVTWKRLLRALPPSFQVPPYATCAVVGNGGTLRVHASEGRGFGAAIDAHDCVFRFNFAPAGGVHAAAVGSRTTIRVLNRARVLELDRLVDDAVAHVDDPAEAAARAADVVDAQSGAELATLAHVTAPDALEAFVRIVLGDRGKGQRPRHGIGGGAEFAYNPAGGGARRLLAATAQANRTAARRPASARQLLSGNSTDHPPRLLALDPSFHEHVLRAYRTLLATARSIPISADSPATSGFYGVLLALSACRRVTLYGFAREWGPVHPTLGDGVLRVPYHYFDDEEPNAGQKLRDDTERISLEALERRMVVGDDPRRPVRRLRHGEPCASCDQGPCAACEPGSTCVCGFSHPVPLPGFCYDLVTYGNVASARAHLNCFRKCAGGAAMCPGGRDGTCPSVRLAHGESAVSLACGL